MAKFWTCEIQCPYCKTLQTHVINQHISQASRPQRTQCWNAKEEKGCLQPFDVSFQIQVQCMKAGAPEMKKLTLNPVFESDESRG